MKEVVGILKRYAFYGFLISGMVLLISLMTYSHVKILELDSIDSTNPYFYQLIIYSLLFGVLLEWDKMKYLVKGNFKINILIVPFILIMIISIVPPFQWAVWFGLGKEGWLILIYPLRFIPIHTSLAILSGVLLVRSFVDSK